MNWRNFTRIKPKSERKAKSVRHPPDVHIERYLTKHTKGLSAQQMHGWLHSRKDDYTLREIELALFRMRDEGKAVCTNGLWWLRTRKEEG